MHARRTTGRAVFGWLFASLLRRLRAVIWPVFS